MHNMEKEVLLSCKEIFKNFGPTRALVNVDFEIRRGEICGLIGENGSGKSTLTSIFAGIQPAVSGKMFRAGEEYHPANMLEAQQKGVAIIVQEAGTLPSMDVAANVFVGNFQKFRRGGFLDVKRMHVEANKILDEIGASDIRANMLVSSLNFEDRKIVEIARAMYLKPDVIIIDETTTALAQKGRTLIYNLIKKFEAEGKAVIFISHDLDELADVCNSIVVLRDGRVISRLEGDEMTVTNMRTLMVGRELTGAYYRGDYDGSFSDEVVLEANHVTSVDGYIKNFNCQLHAGEILGIGGLANSGMHEIGRMMFGVDKMATGQIVHIKTGSRITSPITAIRHRMGYISKDRDKESISLEASIQDNIVLPALDRIKKGIFITGKSEKKFADEQIKTMSIKCISGKQFCSELSGGNKQKVAFAKWLGVDCDIFIMDCPTRGIDIGVKVAMYKLIYELKRQGKSIVMISEELMELIGMSDRMLIMKNGSVSKEIMRSADVTDAQIIEYMI